MVELLEATFLDFLREDEGPTPAFQSRTQTCVPESFLFSVEKLVMALSLLLSFVIAVVAAPSRFGLHGHAFKIHQQRCKTRHRQHALSVWLFPFWNKLPEEIANVSSVEIFKARLDALWQSRCLKSPSNSSPDIVSRTCSILPYRTIVSFLQ